MIGVDTLEAVETPKAVDFDLLFRQYAWPTYIGLCLLLWGVLITAPEAEVWLKAIVHWPMALVMIGGSLVAGSTPMGGGTVAFPALVLGFGESPAMARDFGLAIQSIGMTSALLFIVMRGIPVEKRMLMWSCAGAVVGLTFGTYVLAGWVPADWVKLLFATLWITFGGWLVLGTGKATSEPRPSTEGTNVAVLGLVVGVIGGAVASLIGVGVEMLVYATLVLRFGWGPKAAVPTAVCTTALVSPVGLVLRAMTAGIHPNVFPTWMACVPLVIFGAPAGAYISTRMPRPVLLRIIGALVLVQFAVTVNQVRPSVEMWGGVLALAALSGFGLWMLAPGKRTETEPLLAGPAFALEERLAEAPAEPFMPLIPAPDPIINEPIVRATSVAARSPIDLPYREPVHVPPAPAAPVAPVAPVASAAPVAEVRPSPAPTAPIATSPTAPKAPTASQSPTASTASTASTALTYVDAPVEDPALPFLAHEAASMDGGSFYHFYYLGARLHPLGSVAEGMNRSDWLRRNDQSARFLENLLGVEQSPVAIARNDASQLLKAVKAIAARSDDAIAASEATAIQAALRAFESTFYRQLKNDSVYRIPRVGIYETALLVSSADEMFTPDVWIRLSARTRTDWCAAGRCLAMRLGTACAFHTVRAVESVLHEYYVTVTGSARMKRKDRKWGAYARSLSRHRRMNASSRVDPKLIELIHHLRQQHENPVTDAEATLDANQAYALFNSAHGAIVSFVTATTRLTATPERAAG